MWWDKRQEYYDEPWGGNEDLHNDGCLSMFFWLVVSGIVCFFLGSCKTKYVSVPEYHNVYVEKHDTLVTRDSIYQKDSVYMWMQGDTIWKEKFSVLYKDRWRDKIVYRDSIRVDSIRVPMPVVTERKMRWQDKAAYIGLGFVISLFMIIVSVISFRVFRARNGI
jgi:hypothetical protein